MLVMAKTAELLQVTSGCLVVSGTMPTAIMTTDPGLNLIRSKLGEGSTLTQVMHRCITEKENSALL